LIQEEIKRRSNSGNVCYRSVKNLVSFCRLTKDVKIGIYKTVILPVVLYACETWTLTLREENRMRVFEKRVLRDEVTGEWRKLHNEQLYDLYSSPSIIRMTKLGRMRWA
jgi:hypothetical protein